MRSKNIRRREVLKGFGAAAMPALAGCGDDGEVTGPKAGSIEHVVVLMMENRSFDHFLGSRSLEGLAVDGLTADMTNDDVDGMPRTVYRESTWCVADPPHGWNAAHAQFNDGKNDGFLVAYQAEAGVDVDPHVMSYFTREDIPVTHALADAYGICDRWFCSVMGPTWPNRFYFHLAQSGGVQSNESPAEKLPSIYDRLDEKGVAWKYYYTDLPFLLLIGGGTITPAVPNFFDDAKNGTLPSVSVIDPGFALNDDHPPHHPLLGQQFIAAVYQALATSPLWEKTLLIITYDEHGGFFDHVAPPKTADDRAAEGFDQLGFRVPAMVIGPYVKPGYVSSVQYDHTSILKHLENMFGLEPLTARDAAANDLSDLIDTERLEAGEAAKPIELPTVDIDAATVPDACRSITPFKRSDIEVWFDDRQISKDIDLRPKHGETLRYLADYVARRGVLPSDR